MYQAVIFDLDGTLIDSEPVWFEVYQQLLKKYGKGYEPEFHAQLLGRSGLDCSQRIINHYQLSTTPQELLSEREPIKERIFSVTKIQARPGIGELLKELSSAGIKLGIATASPPAYRDRVLTEVGIRQYFTEFVSGEEVKNPKPAPDIYLKVCHLFGFQAPQCLAVEDGQAGVDSAVAAGIDVLGIADGRFNDHLVGVKHLIKTFENFKAVDLEKF